MKAWWRRYRLEIYGAVTFFSGAFLLQEVWAEVGRFFNWAFNHPLNLAIAVIMLWSAYQVFEFCAEEKRQKRYTVD